MKKQLKIIFMGTPEFAIPTLESLKQAGHRFTTVGIAFDWQALDLDRWTPEAHDQALDLLITNTGVYRNPIKS